MKTIVLTGANSGIGKEAALSLAGAGHNVLMLCRDSEKSHLALAEIKAKTKNDAVSLISVDLSEQSSIRSAAKQIKKQRKKIDVLVNNAGIYKAKRTETTENIEMTLAVNHLAPFLLSQLLMKELEASGTGRIINVVSALYKNGTIDFEDLMLKNNYKAGRAYANSKLACTLCTIELARRVRGLGITANALHPGVLLTDIARDYPRFIMVLLGLILERPCKGGERIAYLACSDEVKKVTGKYFNKEKTEALTVSAQEHDNTERLWKISEKLTGITS